MGSRRANGSVLLVLTVFAGICGGACEQPSGTAPQGTGPTAQDAAAPPGADGSVQGTGGPSGDVVQLCDGETTTAIPHGMPTKVAGAAISAELMAQWKAKNPTREWDTDPDPPRAIVGGADNSGVIANESNQGLQQTYGRITGRDVLTWKREVDRAVAEGDRVFHDADTLGSTIAVSCDMCHPHAANTHPETYPKYQVQLGRVALLRDMINWCLQHPVRAEPMVAEDPRMRAMEAYIYAQRRGVSLDYGRR